MMSPTGSNNMKCSRVQFYFVWWLAVVGSGSCWYGRNDEQKLLFVPDADNEPDVEHEISEPGLFRFLLDEETLEILEYTGADIPDTPDVLKDIDKESKIKEFEIHQSSTGKVDAGGAFHTFVVFKTASQTDGDDWWSLEKNLECIILQRSGNKNDVKRKLDGAERIKVKPEQRRRRSVEGSITKIVVFKLLRNTEGGIRREAGRIFPSDETRR